MSQNLRNTRIKFFLNIVLPSIIALILFIVSLFFIVIPHFERAMMDRKREMITELTNTATSILAKYHKDELEGLISREEAQATAISRIQYLRYGEENKDYFWITDMQPVMIVHPYRPELNGKNLENYLDSHGKQMFIEFVNVVKSQDHGYVEYMWQWKDDPNHIVPKLSYVQGFEPWGWIVGTGIYIEDVKAEIAGLTKRFIQISLLISAIIALILLWIGRQSFNIEKKRIAAEISLKESREKYRFLVEASTEGLIMMMDGKVSFVNYVFEQMTGLKAEEINSEIVEKLIQLPKDVHNKISIGNYDIKHSSTESVVHCPNDVKKDVILNISPINVFGKDALILSVKDISIDKQVKEQLLFSKEKFQTLMDKLNNGIFRTSIDKKGKFIEANQTALKILGYSSFEELEGQYIIDLLVEKDDKLNFRKELLQKGFVRNLTLKLKKKSGEYIFASVSLAVVSDESGPRFCDGIIQDVTMQMNNELDTINIAYTSFMQMISQPVSSSANKPALCKYDTNLEQLSSEMDAAKSNAVVVLGPEKEILGYITNTSIRSRVFKHKNIDQVKAFQIMSSPLEIFDENISVGEAAYMLNKTESELVFITNSTGEISGYISKSELFNLQEFLPVQTVIAASNAKTSHDLKSIYDKYVMSVLPLIEANTHSEMIFRKLAFVSDVITKRIIEMAIQSFGEPPVKFAFISMGSEGRMEQTLSTDQDNAIIFEDCENIEQAQEYFSAIAEYISDALNHTGYVYCKGGIMAKNPIYCKPVSVWKNYFIKWINNGSAKDLLDICVFFDFRLSYGEEKIVKDMRTFISQLTDRNPAYLLLLAQNNLKLKPQVGFWGNILLETAGAPPETVNIKEAIAPIVNFARVYALKAGLSQVNTQERLKILHQKDILNESTYKNISQAFDYLAVMRLSHQASLVKNNLKPDNIVNTKVLSDLDKTIIKKLLAHINTMLSKLSYDFKGTM